VSILKRFRWIVLVGVFTLVAAACGGDSADDTTETTAAATTAATEAEMVEAICEVTDTGGVDDKSFNQLAYDGAEAAEAELGWEARVLESAAETDYQPNINSFVASGECNLIVTVGFLLGADTEAAANANPDQPFAIVDFAYGDKVDENFEPVLDADGNTIPAITNGNVQGLVFVIDQAAFLAGYIAADQTQTGIVGTFGGINIPPVSAFMEGFAQGVAYYNGEKGTDVQVLGWSIEDQDGLFTGNFDSLEDGRAFAENLADEGADIILPVAGPVGLGAAALVQERGLRIIGVDADWNDTAPEYSDVILTSILKNIHIAVLDAAKAVDAGNAGELLVSTLASGGVGVAPITNAMNDNAGLQAELDALIAAIIAGDIVTSSS
jgi:basic membrane protein A